MSTLPSCGRAASEAVLQCTHSGVDWLLTARVGLCGRGCAAPGMHIVNLQPQEGTASVGSTLQRLLFACLQWLLVTMLLPSSLWNPEMSVVYLLSSKRGSSAEFTVTSWSVPGGTEINVYASGVRLKPALGWVGSKPYELPFSVVVVHVETWTPIFPLFNGEVTDCKRNSAGPS